MNRPGSWIKPLFWWSGFAILILLVFLLRVDTVYAAAPKAPVILSPKMNERVLTFNPLITGVAENNTRVIIIIDDKIVGSVKTKNGKKSGTFLYRSRKLKAGSHTAYAVAERLGLRSGNSTKMSFSIPKDVTRKLDGVIVPLEKYRSWPVAVMVENISSIRSTQRGLSQASVVYETLAEGGVTRFLALFDGENIKADRIMPVRSTRPYYVQWAREYGAVIMHAGGSPDGVKEIQRLHLQDAEALKGKTANYFWRSGGSGVHNLATGVSRIVQMLKNFGRSELIPDFRSWKFKSEAKVTDRGTGPKSLSVAFSSSAYTAEYRYDRAKNLYLRWNGGRPQIDANTKKQLMAKNILVQYVPRERVLDRKGRLSIKTTGAGKGLLLRDGQLINVTWRKDTASGRTVFSYANTKKEIELNRGTTWVEVVPAGKKVTIRK